MSRDASKAIYDEAGIGPEDVDLAQCHDAFAIEELEYYELLGFCKPGEAEGLIERGDTSIGGKIPFSTDGGLIARGHPGGPTGLAQIWETTLQLRGEAGPRQVEGARVGLCHMMGGGSRLLHSHAEEGMTSRLRAEREALWPGWGRFRRLRDS